MTNTTEASLLVKVSAHVNQYVDAKNALLEVLAEVKEANEKLNLYYESVSQRLTQDAKALAEL
jgi:hypothetical protein